VTLLRIDTRSCCSASFAATYASGYPVAFDASAEDRERRALTSIMQYSSLCGLSAYWMLHSPTTPRCRTTFSAVLRRLKYSELLSVCEGATTIESPVWTPSGSKFSMLQTVMQLSLQSRTTSYSTSFHPRRSWSTMTWSVDAKALAANARSSASSCANPDPKPPSAKAARRRTGYLGKSEW
jgi:hypothetical protein